MIIDMCWRDKKSLIDIQTSISFQKGLLKIDVSLDNDIFIKYIAKTKQSKMKKHFQQCSPDIKDE